MSEHNAGSGDNYSLNPMSEQNAGSGDRCFRFESTEIDIGGFTLRRDGDTVEVQPQVFDVLAYLVLHRDRLITKEELLDNIWGDRFVGESALSSRIKSARQAIGDDGRQQRLIKTVHGRGFRFVGDVTEIESNEALIAQTPTLPSGGPAQRSDPRRGPVAPPRTSTFGRESEQETITNAVRDRALVTLRGPAGVGKTHLARLVAAQLQDEFSDGAVFVSLSNLRDPSAVAEAVLEGLGATRLDSMSPVEAARARLADWSGLLVLDNCEHVLSGVTSIVGRNDGGTGPARVLATSRHRLQVDGEHVFDLDVLESDQSAALFTDRLRSLGATAPADSSAIAVLCERLDHLPLAIELATGQARVLGVETLSAMLDERLELLTDRSEADPHRRTLAGAIAWSVDDLDAELSDTLFRLSTFSGPFDLEAAVAVAAADRDLDGVQQVHQLVELVERSLVSLDDGMAGRRYRLLESVRLFCAQQLAPDDARAARSAHLRHYRAMAELRLARLRAPGFEDEFHGFADDWDNDRAAIEYSLDVGAIDDALALLLATADWADAVRRREHADWCRRVLAVAPPSSERERLNAALARSIVFDDIGEFRRLLNEVEDLTTYEALTARAFEVGDHHTNGDQTLRNMVRFTGGYHEFLERTQAAYWQVRQGRDPSDAVDRLRVMSAGAGPIGATHVLLGEAIAAIAEGRFDAALDLLEQVYTRCSELGLELISAASQHFRTTALTFHPEPERLARGLATTFQRYEEHRLWTLVTKDAPVAASVLARAERRGEALVLLGAYLAHPHTDAAWATTFLNAHAEFPDRDRHVERGRAMDDHAVCRFAIDELMALDQLTD